MKKLFISITSFIALFVLFMPIQVKAKTLQDLYNQLAGLQAEYKTNKQNRDLTQAEINKLNSDIASISNTIERTREEIKQAEKDIEDSKAKIESKKIETDGLIQFL